MDDKLLEKMRGLCARRECCVSDVRAKALKALDGDEEGAREIVESLVADGFVDDFRYASAFARDKSALSGWGGAKIGFALARKGVSLEIIREALGEVDVERADARMRSLLEARYRSLAGVSDARLRLLRYALGRGYAYEEAREAVDEIVRQSGDACGR